MTRIISGFAGSLQLRVPKSGTRPTSDRTREGIFSALQARDAMSEARVLDLYAGSGALGSNARAAEPPPSPSSIVRPTPRQCAAATRSWCRRRLLPEAP